MDFNNEDENPNADDFLEGYPGILIPCENAFALQQLIFLLYDCDILDGEVSYLLKNVPENMMEILNDPEYFETTEICGIILSKSQLKSFEVPLNELL